MRALILQLSKQTLAAETAASLTMKVRRYAGLDGDDGGTLPCFDATSRLQSLAVVDDDTGSLLGTSTSRLGHGGPAHDDNQRCSSSPVSFVEQRLRPLLFVLFSLLPSLAVIMALSFWTYTFVQVGLDVIIPRVSFRHLAEGKTPPKLRKSPKFQKSL